MQLIATRRRFTVLAFCGANISVVYAAMTTIAASTRTRAMPIITASKKQKKE